MEETKRVTGVDELKIVAHPLRVRMLGELRRSGPATATELAKRFETDTGTTSYHLRKLADAGFVVEIDDPGGHHRSRRWQAVHKTTSWSNAEMAATPEGREVVGFMHRRQVESLMENVLRFDAQIDELPPEWVESAGMSDMLVRLTARSLNELFELCQAEAVRLSERDASDPEARPVALFVSGIPL